MVIEKVIDFISRFNVRARNELIQDKTELELKYPLPFLKQLRLGTCRRVFEKFLIQLAKVNFLNIVEEKEGNNKNWLKHFLIRTPEAN